MSVEKYYGENREYKDAHRVMNEHTWLKSYQSPLFNNTIGHPPTIITTYFPTINL
jgi:hypothetical protein